MNGVTKEQKIKIIIEYSKKYGITGYEIAKNTTITESAVNRILNGKTQNPNINTVNAIINYVEQRITGADLNPDGSVKAEVLKLAEPTPSYDVDTSRDGILKRYFKLSEQYAQLEKDLQQQIITIQRLKHLLEKHNIDFKHITEI